MHLPRLEKRKEKTGIMSNVLCWTCSEKPWQKKDAFWYLTLPMLFNTKPFCSQNTMMSFLDPCLYVKRLTCRWWSETSFFSCTRLSLKHIRTIHIPGQHKRSCLYLCSVRIQGNYWTAAMEKPNRQLWYKARTNAGVVTTMKPDPWAPFVCGGGSFNAISPKIHSGQPHPDPWQWSRLTWRNLPDRGPVVTVVTLHGAN